jgi:hypothetical protein
MSSTILVVIVLIVMWFVVLVPMFVRRHDESIETRSMDRFATARRVLSRRSRTTDPSLSRPRAEMMPPTSATAARIRADCRRRMMARRRRTLATLTGLLFAGLGGALALAAWLWTVTTIAGLLLAGYLGWLRQEARRQHARAARRAAVFSRSTPSQPPHVARVAAAAPTADTESAGTESPVPAPTRRTGRVIRPGWATRKTVAAPSPAAAPAAAAEYTGAWEPTPVPLPTYVTKAPAFPGTAVGLDDDDPMFSDIDAIIAPVDRRRAANE